VANRPVGGGVFGAVVVVGVVVVVVVLVVVVGVVGVGVVVPTSSHPVRCSPFTHVSRRPLPPLRTSVPGPPSR
jgi:hypothetical protein